MDRASPSSATRSATLASPPGAASVDGWACDTRVRLAQGSATDLRAALQAADATYAARPPTSLATTHCCTFTDRSWPEAWLVPGGGP